MGWGNSFQTYEKKRYAYLEVGNVGNSRLFREKGVMVLTRIAWAAITISLNKGFPTTSDLERGIAVPRLNRSMFFINLIYSYNLLFSCIFDTQ